MIPKNVQSTKKKKKMYNRQTGKMARAVLLPYSPHLYLIYTIIYVVLLQSKILNYVFSKERVFSER